MTDHGGRAGDADAVLRRMLAPALTEAESSLEGAPPGSPERSRLAALLAAAAEDAQQALGDRAREPRLHRIVGAAASTSMALALGDGLVADADVRARLREGLELLAAGS